MEKEKIKDSESESQGAAAAGTGSELRAMEIWSGQSTPAAAAAAEESLRRPIRARWTVHRRARRGCQGFHISSVCT